jgi:hypothetical protein
MILSLTGKRNERERGILGKTILGMPREVAVVMIQDPSTLLSIR